MLNVSIYQDFDIRRSVYTAMDAYRDVSAIFFKRREDFSCFLKRNQHFQISFYVPYVLSTFKLRTLCARFYLFALYI